jgi:prepilin-type processing-associated H-X9-DG protein
LTTPANRLAGRLAAAFLVFAALLFPTGPARAEASCKGVRFDSQNYSVCRSGGTGLTLETFSLNKDGQPFRFLFSLQQELAAEGKTLRFAMNAGMFGEDYLPIGLYVEDGKQAKKLNRKGGSGNFHLRPNGVFFIRNGKPGVMETEAFAKSGLKPEFASQSGPMLVIDGKLHPKFSPQGTSRKVRNGVGIDGEGNAIFAISEDAVTFHEFARLFRDGLKCRNALFFDGSVSSLYAAEIGRNDGFLPLGPMVGAFEKE